MRHLKSTGKVGKTGLFENGYIIHVKWREGIAYPVSPADPLLKSGFR